MYDILRTDVGVSMNCKSGHIQMKGSEVFKNAVEKNIRISESVKSLLKSNNFSIEDVDLLFPHEANQRIVNSIANKLNLPDEEVTVNIEKHANCSAASISLALSELKSTKGIERVMLIVLIEFSAKTTWGSILVRW